MPLPDPQPGMVLSYSYLWLREHREGEEEGRKDRPVVVILAIEDDDGEPIVTVVPVTTSVPNDPGDVLEIPAQTKQRLGLGERQSFVVLTEVNRFRWPGPDLKPVVPGRFDYGYLPARTFDRLTSRVEELARRCRVGLVRRSE